MPNNQDEQLIDDIYEYTGLIFSEARAKDFRKLIAHYIEEYKITYFCECDKVDKQVKER